MDLRAWEKALEGVLPRTIGWRRHIHDHPELSGQEKETARLVREVLEGAGVAVTALSPDTYSLMGQLRSGEGPCIAIRADMDALPVRHRTEDHLHPGVSHACGHDVHTALALGSALWLAENRDRWRGTVRWLFEGAEETTGDARLMAEAGWLRGVGAVMGQHVNPSLPLGTVLCKPGVVNGCSDDVLLEVQGRSGHGAYPESGRDAIVIAAQVIAALQSLISRETSPFCPVALTFGRIEGGAAGNVICERVVLRGTLRTLDQESRARMHRRIGEIAQGVALAMDARAEVRVSPSYPPLHNDQGLYAQAERSARQVLGDGAFLRREQPSLGVESFAFLLAKTPGIFYDLGCGPGPALHTAGFHCPDGAVLPGLAMQCDLALRLLHILKK